MPESAIWTRTSIRLAGRGCLHRPGLICRPGPCGGGGAVGRSDLVVRQSSGLHGRERLGPHSRLEGSRVPHERYGCFRWTELPRRMAVIGAGPMDVNWRRHLRDSAAAFRCLKLCTASCRNEDRDAAEIVQRVMAKDGGHAATVAERMRAGDHLQRKASSRGVPWPAP